MNMKKKLFERRHLVEFFVITAMRISLVIVAGALALILWTVVSRGFPSLSWEMTPVTPIGKRSSRRPVFPNKENWKDIST